MRKRRQKEKTQKKIFFENSQKNTLLEKTNQGAGNKEAKAKGKNTHSKFYKFLWS